MLRPLVPGLKCFAVMLSLSLAPLCHAAADDPAPPVHFYQLRFDVEEVSPAGKITNSRTYQTIISTARGERDGIRTGTKVPVVTGIVTNDKTDNKQFQYLDVGVNVDINDARETGDQIAMQVKTEISSIARPEANPVSHIEDPVIRQNHWFSQILVTAGKPKVIFSSDNLDDKGKMQVELTATRID